MGKGEELHMELEFDRDVIHCWEIAADGTLCQEETLETIVPDACPDILRIVAVCGQATLNGKQAREGAAAGTSSIESIVPVVSRPKSHFIRKPLSLLFSV